MPSVIESNTGPLYNLRADECSEPGHYFDHPLANRMGFTCFGVITRLRKLLNHFSIPSQIIIGSKSAILNVTEWLEVRAYLVTVTPSLLDSMIGNPYAEESVQNILCDAAKVNKIVR